MGKLSRILAIGAAVVVAGVFGGTALSLAVSGGTTAPVVTERMQADLGSLTAALEARGIAIESAEMDLTRDPAYAISFSTDSWPDLVERVDTALRVASLQRMRGELSENVLFLRVMPPRGAKLPPNLTPGERAPLDFRLQDVDLSMWDFTPSISKPTVAARVIPQVEKIAATHGISLRAADIAAKEDTYLLDVAVAMDPATQLEDLSHFAEQLWGLVPPENAASHSIGLGRLRISDLNGSLLAYEINDFIVSYRQVHSDINYPFYDGQ